jgi:hypothetical protein
MTTTFTPASSSEQRTQGPRALSVREFREMYQAAERREPRATTKRVRPNTGRASRIATNTRSRGSRRGATCSASSGDDPGGESDSDEPSNGRFVDADTALSGVTS